MEYTVYQSQYAAALDMLREVIRRCPRSCGMIPPPRTASGGWLTTRFSLHICIFTRNLRISLPGPNTAPKLRLWA